MPTSRQDLIDSYVSAMHRGDAALFVGAGMSRASGFVDWKALLRGCAQEIGLDLDREHDLVAVAQYYLNRREGDRWKLNQVLRNEFGRPGTFTENHKIIGRLPISTIWTTNFDTLIEQALLAGGRSVDVKSRDMDIPNAKKDEVTLYKMHGDIARPEEVVICKADYERYAEEHPVFQNALAGDLVNKTFLFLGFSFSDPHLNYMLGHLHVLLRGRTRPHFALLREVRADRSKGEEGLRIYEYDRNKQDLMITELQRYRINTHLVQRFGDVTDILKAIEKRSYQKTVFVSGSANKYEATFDENRMRDLCMHLGELLIERGYRLVSGFGLNIGDSVIKGALLKLYEKKDVAIEDHLVLRPFPRNLPPEVSESQFNLSYRESMISKCGFAIFLSGTSRSSVISAGVLQEYEVARSFGKIPIPVGATGFAARSLWNTMQPEIESVYAGAVTAELYGRLNDAALSNAQILDAVFDIIGKVAER